jgi:hypothetical protein
MSDWRGNSNPGHARRLALWQALEEDFGEPLADTIQGLCEQGNSWRTVAGALGISLSTLREWRRALDLPLDTHDKLRDESSTPEQTQTDERAIALGYQNAEDAVLDMRLVQHLTIQQASIVLGVHPATIMNYTPKKIRGSIYNRSEYWWEVRRQQARAMNEKNNPTEWRATNDLMWREILARS